MFTGSLPVASNREDYEYIAQIVDDDTNEPIDLTAATIVAQVSDKDGCKRILLGTSTGGAESGTLLTANLPPYTPAGTITNGAIAGNVLNPSQSGSSAFANGSFGSPVVSQAASTFIGIAQGGTSTPVATVQPTILVTIYLKL